MGQFWKEFIRREQISGMIFDVDGTMLDSMPVWDHSGEQYLRTLGIYAPSELGKILFSKTMRQGAEYIKKTYRLINQTEEEIQKGIIKVVEDAYQNQVPLKPYTRAFLDGLRDADIPMVVVTSTDRPLIQAAFSRLGLEPYFTKIFTCSAFGSGKDRPEIFHAASEAMHSAPSSTWVVEDGLYAIRTAKAAGYRVIGVADASSQGDEAQIRALADYFITGFAMEVTGC